MNYLQMQPVLKTVGSVLLFTPFSLIAGCAYVLSNESTVSFDELPDNIQLLASAEIQNREIIEVEKEFGFSGISYGITFLSEGRAWEIEYSESGDLLEYKLELDEERQQ